MVGRAVPVGRACLLLLTLLLAGCLGGGSDAKDGGDALDAAEVGPDPTAAANATPEPRPFEWEGRVHTGANGCTGTACLYSGTGREEHRLLNVTGGNLTLTWTAQNELSMRVEPCPRACEYKTSGTSPLTLDITRLSPDTEHFLVVDHVEHDQLRLRVGTETPFRVEGTITVA